MAVFFRSFVTASLLTLGSSGSYAVVSPPVEASYTVSGTSGNWLVDFTFTNNFAQPNWSLYFAGIRVGATDIASSPAGYNNSYSSYPDFNLNAGAAPVLWDGTFFDNNWYNPSANTLRSGTSLSGFKAVSHQAEAPTSIPWLVFVYNFEEPYTGSDYIYRVGNPGFQGVAVAAVPEPESYAMMLLGLGVIGTWVRRRKEVQA